MRRIRPYLIALCLCLLLAACGKEESPQNILSEAEMVPVLKDMQLAYAGIDHTVRNPRQRSVKYEEMNQLILKKHKMDRGKFYESYRWYQAQPPLMDTLFQQVIHELENELTEIQKNRKEEKPKPKLPLSK